MTRLPVFVARVVLLGLVVAACPAPLSAQSLTETKIRLMADALRARDSGDLELAERNLTELVELAPDDPSVRRLLKTVQSALAEERERLNLDGGAAELAEKVEPVAGGGEPPLVPLASEPDPWSASESASGVGAQAEASAVDAMAAMAAEIEAAAAAEEARQLGGPGAGF